MSKYNSVQLKMYDDLGNHLLKSGRGFKKKVFDIKDNKIYMIERSAIINMLKNLGFRSFGFADRYHYYLDLEVMKGIIAGDWTDKREYLAEKFDCDDFAFAFKAHMSEIYLINSVALAKHIDTTLSNGEQIWHRAAIFLAKDQGVVSPYLLETQNDGMIQITGNTKISLGKWKYKLNTIEF